MNFHLTKLSIHFKRAVEEIWFSDVTYFFGQMGSGKTSIARLIDYCLGGAINLTPALLSEFVTVELHLVVNGVPLLIERPRDADQAIAIWNDEQGNRLEVQVPVKPTGEIVVPNSSVESLSDLIYYVAGIQAPKVRKSKINDDSSLQRLSFRNLFWYCYIDQDEIDSNFYHLAEDAHPFKRLNSRDVMRFILGFHQENVADLEAKLQELHIEKLKLNEAANALENVIKESNFGDESEISEAIIRANIRLEVVNAELSQLRSQRENLPHLTDILKNDARAAGFELESIENAIADVKKKIDQDLRHKNEILTLDVKIKRMAGARAVLGGVAFKTCPRCTQALPERQANECIVCGQEEPTVGIQNLDPDVLHQDARGRIDELEDMINLQLRQLKNMERRRTELIAIKAKIDNDISELLRDYDSAFLSNAIKLERESSQIAEQVLNLTNLLALPRKVTSLRDKAIETEATEIATREELKTARQKAEADTSNLDSLKELFLDCLIRSGLPGINSDCIVNISAKDFLPIVTSPELEDVAVTSFANLSSGGKKTLFKACFAIAIHRLSAKIGASLPTILIIDSPMKNISERENKTQFENFHRLIYDLAQDELEDTQIILIDKECFYPDEGEFINMSVRHMTLDNPIYPPLIPYYNG